MLLGASSTTMRGAADRRAGRAVAVALCLAAAVALTACNSRRHQAVPVASAADLPAATQAAEPAATQLAATAPVAGTEASAPASAAPSIAGPAPAPDAATGEAATASFETAPPADPDEVMGLGRNAVQELLGKPGLVRREAPAEVWQYQSRGCVLDLFLYEEAAEFEVVYIEARTGHAITAATDACLGAVIDQRNPPTS